MQGFLILLLPYEKLVNLYMHLIVGVLLIVIEIVSRVYIEEEIEVEGSQNQSELLSSSAYYKRQVSSRNYPEKKAVLLFILLQFSYFQVLHGFQGNL